MPFALALSILINPKSAKVLIKNNKACRVCGIVPAAGWCVSKLTRSNWLCNDCEAKKRKAMRRKILLEAKNKIDRQFADAQEAGQDGGV